MIPIMKGTWIKNGSKPHTLKNKGSGTVGSARVLVFPSHTGSGVTGPDIMKIMIRLGGVADARGEMLRKTASVENAAKSTIVALRQTYFARNLCTSLYLIEDFYFFP